MRTSHERRGATAEGRKAAAPPSGAALFGSSRPFRAPPGGRACGRAAMARRRPTRDRARCILRGMWRISIALLAFVTFGCTTVRVPVSSLPERLGPVSGAIAEPQVELWLESGEPVPPAEIEAARQQVHAALGAALAGRTVDPDALGAADALLLVRTRAVARTASRRSDQRTAVVALVVGIVVVVAGVIVMVVVAKDAPRSAPRAAASAPSASRAAPRLTAPARAAPAVRAGAPALAPAVRPRPGSGAVTRAVPAPGGAARPSPVPGVRPAPVSGGRRVPAPAPFTTVPAPWAPRYAPSYGPHVWFGFDFVYVLPEPCCVVAPLEPPYPAPPPPEPAYAMPSTPPPASGEQVWADDLPGANEPPPAESVDLAIPPPPAFSVESRGFLAGDETVLEVDLFDHATGALLWTRVVRDGVDPRDAPEVMKLLDRALENEPWVRREAPVPAPERR
jgi:hypothetical protein